MNDALAHRGPDGEGIWTDSLIGLGHRRLAIVDIPGGAQPMANEDRSVWVVCNGEIYNHAKLRSTLESKGHRYRSRSDTEVILHLYEEVGHGCVDQLEGMFAFALWDARHRRLLLARDRLGIKPLYYAHTGRELLFGSEVKAILASGGITASFNRAILPEFLATNFVSGEETFFESIKKLLPGRVLSWSPSEGMRTRRYWRPAQPEGEHTRTVAECSHELRARLEGAVRSHQMSDVPLGLFLSGGLDSSALAALMARNCREPIRTYSVGLEEPDCNELPFARRVARWLGASHRDVTVSRGDFFAILPKLVWHEDEPIAFPSSVLLYLVSKLAREDVKVVLSGEGADELFLGYNRYRVANFNYRLGSFYWASAPPSARAAVRRSLNRLPDSIRRHAERSFLALGAAPRELYCEPFSTFPERLQSQVLRTTGSTGNRDPHASWLSAHAEGSGSVLERISVADIQTYLVELLMKQDQMSMAASIESRVPYLDHTLVEYATAMPSALKMRRLRTKVVLRDAVRDLVPGEVLTRRKMGFPVPVGRWLRGPSRSMLDEFVLDERCLGRELFNPLVLRQLVEQHRSGKANHGDRMWLLINLELWHRMFVDGERADAIVA